MIETLKLFPKEMIGNEKGPFRLYYIEDELGLKDVNDIVGPAKFGYDPSIDPE